MKYKFFDRTDKQVFNTLLTSSNNTKILKYIKHIRKSVLQYVKRASILFLALFKI